MYELKCEHELKHNKESDIVFCVKCGERWEKGKITYIPQHINQPIGLPTSTALPHYHNGVPCYENPCVWYGN